MTRRFSSNWTFANTTPIDDDSSDNELAPPYGRGSLGGRFSTGGGGVTGRLSTGSRLSGNWTFAKLDQKYEKDTYDYYNRKFESSSESSSEDDEPIAKRSRLSGGSRASGNWTFSNQKTPTKSGGRTKYTYYDNLPKESHDNDDKVKGGYGASGGAHGGHGHGFHSDDGFKFDPLIAPVGIHAGGGHHEHAHMSDDGWRFDPLNLPKH